MRFNSFLLASCLFFLSFITKAQMQSPAEKPQVTWMFHQILNREISYSITRKVATNPMNTDFKNGAPFTTKIHNNTLTVKGGWGLGFLLEVPHEKWLNLGFSLKMFGNSPDDGMEGLFKLKGGRWTSRIQFHTRFQYPLRQGIFTINPNILLGIGLGGGLELVEKDKDFNDGEQGAPFILPVSIGAGVDFYIGKWYAITAGVHYVVEPGIDPLMKELDKSDSIEGVSTFFNKELSIVFGFKSTYL